MVKMLFFSVSEHLGSFSRENGYCLDSLVLSYSPRCRSANQSEVLLFAFTAALRFFGIWVNILIMYIALNVVSSLSFGFPQCSSACLEPPFSILRYCVFRLSLRYFSFRWYQIMNSTEHHQYIAKVFRFC